MDKKLDILFDVFEVFLSVKFMQLFVVQRHVSHYIGGNW